MRRPLLLATAAAAGLAALGGAAAWTGWAGPRTCGWADRLLGFSGCAGSVRIAGALPARSEHPAVTDAGGLLTIAARLRADEDWQAGLVRVDPETGAETGRFLGMVQATRGYRTDGGLIWSADSRALYAIRSDRGDTVIDRFPLAAVAATRP